MQTDNYIKIFDTTLRDGEQCPGAAMSEQEKLSLATQLAKLNVDVIEAGFPVSSPVQFRTVERIASEVDGPYIAALCRAVSSDIEAAAKALKNAKLPCIHTFIATSNIHMKYKLNKTPDQVMQTAIKAVKLSKEFVDNVEFSAEDASRSDISFLIEIVEAVIEVGATTINLPDTVGYMSPSEYGKMFSTLEKKVNNIDQVILSAHCHNDLGLATSNSLHAALNGARQIECTINGIGERAGNTSLEEIVMAIKTRNNIFPFQTRIKTEEIYKTSVMTSSLTGLAVQRNKAIVGANAFAHESGIHQDGMLKNKLTYEIMTPESIGLGSNKIVLGRHSGRAGFINKLTQMGIELQESDIELAYQKFLEIADRKKEVFDTDLLLLLHNIKYTKNGINQPKKYTLKSFELDVKSSECKAKVTLKSSDKHLSATFKGNGTINVLFCAIEKALGLETKLKKFDLTPRSIGKDAFAEASVGIKIEDKLYYGKAHSPDIIEAALKAFIMAINDSFTIKTIYVKDSGV